MHHAEGQFEHDYTEAGLLLILGVETEKHNSRRSARRANPDETIWCIHDGASPTS